MDAEMRYLHLAQKVRDMLAAQKAYFKSSKNYQLLKVREAKEKEVENIVNPKPNKVKQLQLPVK